MWSCVMIDAITARSQGELGFGDVTDRPFKNVIEPRKGTHRQEIATYTTGLKFAVFSCTPSKALRIRVWVVLSYIAHT